MEKLEENIKYNRYIVSLTHRFLEKNRNVIIELSKKYVEIFNQYGVLQHDIFQLVKPHDDDKQYFNHLEKVVSANLQDEEIWIEIIHYNDKNHWLETSAKMEKNIDCQQGWQEFTNLLTPGSNVICNEFGRLNEIGFE
jgi:hypothetical protein